MRVALTTLLLLVAGLLAGSVAAQVIATFFGADQEFVVAYGMLVLVWLVSSLAFFLAQFLASPVDAAGTIGRVLAVLVLLGGLGLVGLDWLAGGSSGSPLVLIAGLTLPGLVTILVQWQIVRALGRRARSVPVFGRGREPRP